MAAGLAVAVTVTTGGGVLVRSRHTILLNEQAFGTYPAAGATLDSTKDFVRASIGGNSLATLGRAKQFIEAS